MGNLSVAKVRSLTEPGRYSDGDGLMLKIKPGGTKSWVLRVQVAGKRRDIGLGSAKGVSLADARKAAGQVRRKLAQGIDPVAERKQEKAVIPSFREAAVLVHEEHKASWKNGKHQAQWLSTLKSYVYPDLGDVLVSDI